jgi:hypothetical protein
MAGLASQEEDAPKRILFFKPMSWLSRIRPHRRDEAWSAGLWQTFFAMTMGAQIPVIAEKPLAACGCRKFQLDVLGDHLCTCTAHSGAKKTHDWAVDQLADLFRTTHKVKTVQVAKCRGRHCGDIKLAAYLANAAGPVPLVLTLVFTDTYITLMILINCSMKLPLTRSESIELTTIITHLRLLHLCLLLQVRLGGYMVNSCDFYSYRLIGKLTAFLQLQKFSLRKPTVASSTSAARLSLHSSKAGLAWLSLRL